MGLDINASRVTKWRVYKNKNTEDGYVSVYKTKDFDRLDGYKQGWYEGEYVLDFRAGSYSVYNQWRNYLSLAMLGVSDYQVWESWRSYANKPFYKLITFSDCDGCIGPKTSKGLLKDFEGSRGKMEDYLDRLVKNGAFDNETAVFVMQKYDLWTSAFTHAAAGGFVHFC